MARRPVSEIVAERLLVGERIMAAHAQDVRVVLDGDFKYELVSRGQKLREIKVTRIIQEPLQAGGAAE